MNPAKVSNKCFSCKAVKKEEKGTKRERPVAKLIQLHTRNRTRTRSRSHTGHGIQPRALSTPRRLVGKHVS